jgi:hypothetical protein
VKFAWRRKKTWVFFLHTGKWWWKFMADVRQIAMVKWRSCDVYNILNVLRVKKTWGFHLHAGNGAGNPCGFSQGAEKAMAWTLIAGHRWRRG